jgi:hypothetical protein
MPLHPILSHTWAPVDTEEVSVDDLVGESVAAKPGRKKLIFCAQKAQEDGLQYFGVDACCIDKLNKAELSHATCSMFRWYTKSVRCYLYLSNVSTRNERGKLMHHATVPPGRCIQVQQMVYSRLDDSASTSGFSEEMVVRGSVQKIEHTHYLVSLASI